MDTRLPNLLHDLASEMPTDTRTPQRRTLRRARNRRAATVAFTGMTVVAVVFGTLAGLRALAPSDPSREPIVPGTDAPTPQPTPAPASFQGLWPETDADALAETQAQVDAGHVPLRADPEGTASLLAVNVLGWEPEAAHTSFVERGTPDTIVELRNTTFGEDTPPITVVLGQLGRTGENGVWSVVRVSSPLIDSAVEVDAATEAGETSITFGGTLAEIASDSVVRFEVLTGPISEEGTIAGEVIVDGATFSGSAGSWPAEPNALQGAVLWIHIVDAATRSLAATAVALGGTDAPAQETPDVAPPSPDFSALPPDVAVTAQRIYDGALTRDFDALAELLDPNTFVYKFDDGSDPIPAWRHDPSVLDLMVAVLQLPAAEPREIEGYGTFYLWPYLIDSNFANLTEQERADLHFLGYSDEEIQLMIDGGYGYQGPRLGVDATGLWRNFTTMGE